jgi:hypothetical protein
MKIKKPNFTDVNTVSIGVIEGVKKRVNGSAKYRITYRDYKGREYSAWTDWMRDDGYEIGDSIPVSNLSIPSFGLLNVPTSVNNHPQHHVEPYVAAMVLAGVGALIAGYNIGKNSKE